MFSFHDIGVQSYAIVVHKEWNVVVGITLL